MELAKLIAPRRPPVPRVVVLGDSGVGKTTYAAKFPAPIFLDVEFGTGSLDVPTIPIKSVADFNAAVLALRTEKHDFRTVVVDSADWLELHLLQAVCEEGKRKSLADFDYGRGYDALSEKWKSVVFALDGLRAKGIGVVMISHAAPETIKRPDTAEYQQMGAALKRPQDRAKLIEWADIVVYVARKGATRVFSAEPSAGYIAKCRYAGVPPASVADPEQLLAAITGGKTKTENTDTENRIIEA